MFDDTGIRGDLDRRQIGESHETRSRGGNRQVLDVVQVAADFGYSLDDDVEDLLVDEQRPDFESLDVGCNQSAHVTGGDARLFSRSQVHVDLDGGLDIERFDVGAGHAVDRLQSTCDLGRLDLEDAMLLSEQPHGDIACVGLAPAGDPIRRVFRHPPRETGIAVHHFFDSAKCCLVVGGGIDADPDFTGVGAANLVGEHRTTGVGPDVVDSGQGAELFADPGTDAIHLRQ